MRKLYLDDLIGLVVLSVGGHMKIVKLRQDSICDDFNHIVSSEVKSSKLNRFVSCLLTLLISVFCIAVFPANADDDEDDDWGGSSLTIDDLSNTHDFKKLGGMDIRMSAYGNDLMGDMIDKNTGGISFSHTDVSIPGNSGLDVALRRKKSQGAISHTQYQQGFGDWNLDIPMAYFTFGFGPDAYNQPPIFNNGCLTQRRGLDKFISVSSGQATGEVDPDVHTEGSVLYVPGKGLSGFKGNFETPSDPKSNWKSAPRSTDFAGRCATVVIAPDGTQYKFGRHVFRSAKSFDLPVEFFSPPPGYGTGQSLVRAEIAVGRRHAVYLITEVKDVHGNWVRYDYTNNSRAELTRIYSNDGREINLNYESFIPNVLGRNSRRISTVTANGRSWTYDYVKHPQSTNTYKHLHKVHLPDGRYWRLGDSTYGMRGMIYEPHKNYECVPYDVTFDMKHPDGAIGTFRLKETRHIKGAADLGWSGDAHDHWMTPMNIANYTNNNQCFATTPEEPQHYRPGGWPVYQAMSVVSKKISGSGIPTAQWDFEYRNYSGGSLDENWTKVTGPDNTERKYTYQAVGANHGLLKRVDVIPSSGAGETILYEHDLTQSYPIVSCNAGGSFGDSSGMCLTYNYRPVTKLTHQRDGDTYTVETVYNKNGSGGYLDYGRPNRVERYSNVSKSPRITDTTYEHNTSKWVLGLPKTVTQNGRLISTYNYYPDGNLNEHWKYGKRVAAYNYFPSGIAAGKMSSMWDGLNRQTVVSAWHRGKPTSVTQGYGSPDAISWSQTIHNNGWITSQTDPMGRTDSYKYDIMGRLTLIDPQGNWANTSISYNFPPSGGAVQTITKGQSRETVTYDSMYRDVLERTQALDTGWSSYVNKKYDGLGRVIFKSQPSTNQYETKGVDYTYDGLGRIYQERENVAPYATTKHRYYNSHRHRIYDPSGAWTDHYSYGYGGPGNKDYRAIYKYANGAYRQRNYIYKNVHGQMTRLRQWGNVNGYSGDKSQYFYYDAQQRLCRHYVPEHGATKYQYDAAGQMTAYAKGQGNSGCGEVPNVSAKVSMTYDALGRLKVTNFSDPATPDISRTYDANDNLKTVYRDGVNWTYNYNDADMLSHEYLDIDGRNYDSFYYYNTAGHMTRKRMPSGRNVYYTPDGLGRSKTVKNGSTTIASATSFHPNGSLAGMTYGNGQRFTQTLNARLLPHRLLSFKGGNKAIDQTFSYDVRGKVTSIIDGAVSGNNRNYGYDGLGRLTSATGPWGTGSFKYDPLDNLRQKKLGSRTVNLTYDSRNRLSQSADTGPSGTRTVAYDARGNVTTLGNLAFVYDYSDQPVVVSGSANGVGAANGNYVYDGNLKRVKSVVNGKTIYNVYDASGSLVHIDAVSDNKKTDYVSGPNGSLARITNNVVTYLHADHLGTAMSTSNSSGTVACRDKYTPFGETINNPSCHEDLAGFTGHIKDKSTGLNYMQARYYDPTIGRFLSIDPVTFMDTGHPGMFNRYAYTFNDPMNLIDPTGTTPQDGDSSSALFEGLSGELSGCALAGTCDVEQIRENIAKGAEDAYDDGNGTGYAFEDRQGSFGPNSNKCNLFVSDICNAAGANVPSKDGGSWPPLAGDWANPNYNIPGWEIVDSPQRGDIVAQKRDYQDATGHVGIVTRAPYTPGGSYMVISAGTLGLQEEFSSTAFRAYAPGENRGPVVFRRYVGEN